jgi:hypothetical protein
VLFRLPFYAASSSILGNIFKAKNVSLSDFDKVQCFRFRKGYEICVEFSPNKYTNIHAT